MVVGDNLDLDTDFLTDGLFAIRLYDPATQTYKVVANMERGRWYPSVIIMADGNLLIVAGMQEQVSRLHQLHLESRQECLVMQSVRFC